MSDGLTAPLGERARPAPNPHQGAGGGAPHAIAPTSTETELNAAAQAFFDRPPPGDYLAEWAKRLAQPEQEAERDLRSLVVFRLESEWLALSTSQLVEITDPHVIHCIPHRTNPVLKGLVNIRGQLRLCVSLHGLLGVGPGPATPAPTAKAGPLAGAAARTAYSRMMIIAYRAEEWVFPTDEVIGVHRLTQSQFRKVPSTYLQAGSHTQSVFDWNGHTVGYLDIDRVVTALRSHCQ